MFADFFLLQLLFSSVTASHRDWEMDCFDFLNSVHPESENINPQKSFDWNCQRYKIHHHNWQMYPPKYQINILILLICCETIFVTNIRTFWQNFSSVQNVLTYKNCIFDVWGCVDPFTHFHQKNTITFPHSF